MDGKEALESICKTCDNEGCPYIHYENSRCVYYGIVKKDLNKLEKLKEIIKIIKNKNVNISNLKKCIQSGYDHNEYNKWLEKQYCITKEEYKILVSIL